MQSEAQKIQDALRDVIDFEIGFDVISLGLVRDIAVGEKGVKITMIMTSPMCPMATMIMQQVHERTCEVTPKTVEVVLGREQWKPEMMEQEAREALGL